MAAEEEEEEGRGRPPVSQKRSWIYLVPQPENISGRNKEKNRKMDLTEVLEYVYGFIVSLFGPLFITTGDEKVGNVECAASILEAELGMFHFA